MERGASGTLDVLEADHWRLLYECRWSTERRTELLPVLRDLIRDNDLRICRRAMRAFGRIGRTNQPGTLRELVPAITAFVQHADHLTRRVAVGTLCTVGVHDPEVAVPALVQAAQSEDLLMPAMHALIFMETHARASAPLFIVASAHHLGKVRRLALRGLDAIGFAESAFIPVLERALRDKHAEVRKMAAKVLAAKFPTHSVSKASNTP